MPNIIGAFIDSEDSVFVKNGVLVTVYDLNNSLIDTATIGQLPAFSGQANFTNLTTGNIYRFHFTNPNNFPDINLPFDNFFLIPLGASIFTVPVFFSEDCQLYTNTTASFTVPIS